MNNLIGRGILARLKEQILNIKKMENKINVAKLLKDCPKGMELDCLLCNSPIALEGVAVNESTYPIKAVCKDGFIHVLTKYGTIYNHDDAKCVIFPKGKTTWEGFHRPFKDGDIVATKHGHFIGIVKVKNNIQVNTYCAIGILGSFSMNIAYRFERFATEEEKQKLFDAIKSNGYKWNAETKTLEKLIKPKFKVDDKIKLKGKDEFGIITQVSDCFYTIKWKNNTHCWPIKKQDDWELVPNKFDINTLVPFESRVLVREDKTDVWRPTFYGFFHQHSKRFYTTSCGTWLMCIPYNENTKHLTGTTNDCDNFYKTWEK